MKGYPWILQCHYDSKRGLIVTALRVTFRYHPSHQLQSFWVLCDPVQNSQSLFCHILHPQESNERNTRVRITWEISVGSSNTVQ